MCGVPLDDWANGGYVDILFTRGECSEEWIWNLGARSMLHYFREVRCQQGGTLGI